MRNTSFLLMAFQPSRMYLWGCLWLFQARETRFCTCVLAFLSACSWPSFVPKKSPLAIYLFFGDKHCVLLLHMAHATSAKEQLQYHTFTWIFHKNDRGQSVHCPGHLRLHGGLTATFSVLAIFKTPLSKAAYIFSKKKNVCLKHWFFNFFFNHHLKTALKSVITYFQLFAQDLFS